MSSIISSRRLSPLRGAVTTHAVNQKLDEIGVLIRDLQMQVAEARGVGTSPSSVPLGKHLDVQGNRLENVGPTRSEGDVPSVRELRAQALYARDGIHETDKIILARAGVRTLTPAVAANDLVTLGQVRKLIKVANSGVAGAALGVTARALSTTTAAWAYGPQTAVVLADGLTSDWAIPNAVYLRITGPLGPFSVGGFREVGDGRLVILQNATTQPMTIVNEDVATPITHQILTLTGADVVTTGPGIVQLLYSLADTRWILLSSS